MPVAARGTLLDPPKHSSRTSKSTRPAKTSSGASDSPQRTAELQRRFRSAISAKELDLAAGVLAAAKTALTAERAGAGSDEAVRWKLLESEWELADGHPAKAGLAAMEVVVLRPKSEWAGEGLYWAARAYESLNRPAKAADLYRECLEHKNLPSSIRKAAEERRMALTKSAPPKGRR